MAAAAPAHAGPDPLGLEIADVVSRLRRAMRRTARAAGRDGRLPGGLSVAQLELLSCLADSPGARPSQLARLLRLAPSSVATLVQGLRRAGLVSRTGGQRDRRTASLLLTRTAPRSSAPGGRSTSRSCRPRSPAWDRPAAMRSTPPCPGSAS
jgi:DNA-binding CsgD family transcriptional regulator